MGVPEWIKELSLAVVIVLGIVIVARDYINKVASKKGPVPCSHMLNEPLKELVAEFKDEQIARRKVAEKQQEAMNGIVVALTNMCALQTETLTRVKDVERVIK